jgi:hypothetical protein
VASKQAQDTWKRFAAWYGTDALERKFGLAVPVDWADAIEGLDREQLAIVMAETKQKFPTWMPGLPEFETLVAQVRKPAIQDTGPSAQEQLVRFVILNRSLTGNQLRMPWDYLVERFDAVPHGGKNMVHNHGIRIIGVVIPADGDHPGYRVMLADMMLEAA